MARAKPSTGIDMRLRLLGWQEVAKGAETSGRAVRDLGSAAEGAGRKASESQRGWGIFSRNVKATEKHSREARFSVGGLVKSLGALGVGYAAVSGAKAAIEDTVSLGEETLKLQKIQGLSIRQGADLAAVAHVRGLATSKLAMATGQLSHAVQQAVGGNKKSVDLFAQLGIGPDQLAASKNNVLPLLLQVGDAFNKLQGGVQKTDLARTLFGRGGIQSIVPLFKEGPLGLRSLLTQADQTIGQTFGGKNKQQLEDFVAAQTKAQFATFGLQVQLGQFLLPILTKVNSAWAGLVQAIHTGAGPWGTIKTIIGAILVPIRAVVTWFSHSKTASTALGIALAGLGAAWGVEKIVAATRAIKGFWLVTKVQAGIGVLISWLARLRGAYFGVAAAEAAAGAGQLSLFGGAGAAGAAGAGGFAAKALGVAKYAGPIGAFLYGSGLINSDTAGQTPGQEGAGLRGIKRHQFAYYLGHPGQLDRATISGLPPDLRKALRGALAGRHIPGLARGGTLTSAGTVMVGEHGPEYLTLPQGASVRPGHDGNMDGVAATFAAALAKYLHIAGPVYIDGREMAQSTVQWQLVAAARR